MTKVTPERNNITGPAQDNDKILNTLRTEPKLTVVWKRAHRLCVCHFRELWSNVLNGRLEVVT